MFQTLAMPHLRPIEPESLGVLSGNGSFSNLPQAGAVVLWNRFSCASLPPFPHPPIPVLRWPSHPACLSGWLLSHCTTKTSVSINAILHVEPQYKTLHIVITNSKVIFCQA